MPSAARAVKVGSVLVNLHIGPDAGIQIIRNDEKYVWFLCCKERDQEKQSYTGEKSEMVLKT